MQHYKTVLGDVAAADLGVTLPHEHICCYSEYLYQMAGKQYLDKDLLLLYAVEYLKELKKTYHLHTFVDCTPVNIGRDLDLLKRASEQSGVNILCSTGFYYTEEPLVCRLAPERIADFLITDALSSQASILKCAVEQEQISSGLEKILTAIGQAQRSLGLPIVLHTNAKNKNALPALEILLSCGVKPQAITVGHLSDTDDVEYLKTVAAYGCYLGFDRLYGDTSEEYINKTTQKILALTQSGFGDKLLLSHDALFFNGFEPDPQIRKTPRYAYVFDHILPKLPTELAEKITRENPANMLGCGEQHENSHHF